MQRTSLPDHHSGDRGRDILHASRGPTAAVPTPSVSVSLICPQPSMSLRLDVLPAPRPPVSGRRSSWGDPHGKP